MKEIRSEFKMTNGTTEICVESWDVAPDDTHDATHEVIQFVRALQKKGWKFSSPRTGSYDSPWRKSWL